VLLTAIHRAALSGLFVFPMRQDAGPVTSHDAEKSRGVPGPESTD